MACNSSSSKEDLILSLFEAECLKFGSFKLKTGIMSPVYFDLRVIISFPKLMSLVSEFLWSEVKHIKEKFSSVCGVPLTALPMATLVSVNHDLPMLMRRKEAKDYGTKKLIEGNVVRGSNCLVVEDVVTSGSSVLETVEALGSVGLEVTDAVVLLDRQQRGKENLEKNSIKLHSVLTITDVVKVLNKWNKISSETVDEVMRFIAATPAAIPSMPHPPDVDVAGMTISERRDLATQPVAKQLFEIMEAKHSNLCVSVDVTTTDEVLKICDLVGPHVCMVKTHVDIVEDFSIDRWMELRRIASEHRFLIMEDRKFADIGNTVKSQFSGGVHHISTWADLVTVHAIAGPGTVQALEESAECLGRPFGCVLLAEMSSKDNLITSEYTKGVVSMTTEKHKLVAGLVCVNRVTQNPGLLMITPGVKLSAGEDNLGQTYNTPQEVVHVRGSDVIIIGRGIYQSPDMKATAIMYQKAGFQAYLDRLKK